MTPATQPTKPAKAQRLQDGILVLIVLLVGVMAGAASFSHVHDWTMHNSPAGTGDWFGWANAVITELIPTAALIVIARRRRTQAPIGYPMFLLVIAVGLSLTAQLAVAQRSVFGWMVSALPALAFFALSKLVFTATRPPNQVQAPTPATDAQAPSTTDTATATVRPAAIPMTPATTPLPVNNIPDRTPAKQDPAPAPAKPIPALTAANLPSTASEITDRLPGARIFAQAHQDANGERITAGQLAVRLQVPTATAKDILTVLYPEPTTNPGPHNGTPIGATR